ncbi:MAG TPA: MFS transporter [bacterium]|nr:MFS transporter [bacterium]
MGNRRVWLAVALLWLAGSGLRLTILAVPPLLPAIRGEFALSATQVGLLSSIPVALFALAAVPGSLLIARLGTLTTLVAGLLIAAAGSGLRAASGSLDLLYLATGVMGFGIAIMQPVLPAVVREWLPNRIGFGTAVYTNGLLLGEIFPVLLTLPLVLGWVGGSWRAALGVWSIPLAITGVLVAIAAPRPTPKQPAAPQAPKPVVTGRWWPDWRSPLTWQLGALMGSVNSMYFATNAFLPPYLSTTGRAHLISGALGALNFSQLPSSLLLLAVASRIERRGWPYLVAGIMALLGVIGMASTTGVWVLVSASLLGFSGSAVLTLALTLPALLSPQRDVPRTSASMFTIGYASAMAIALVSGAAWDLSGVPRLAFLPIGLCAIALLGSALSLQRTGHLR